MKKLEAHPAALVLPDHNEEERDSMLESLLAHGPTRKVKLHPDGRILDGRHLYTYCQELDIKCEFEDVKPLGYDNWEYDYVFFTLAGREMDKGRKACIANEMRKKITALMQLSSGQKEVNTAKVVAKTTGASERYIYRAAKLEVDAPDLYEALYKGEKGTSLPKQERVLKQRQHGDKKTNGVVVDKKFKHVFGRLIGDVAYEQGRHFTDKSDDTVEVWVGCLEMGLRVRLSYDDGNFRLVGNLTKGGRTGYEKITEEMFDKTLNTGGQYDAKIRGYERNKEESELGLF
jgi:hypothetical protein